MRTPALVLVALVALAAFPLVASAAASWEYDGTIGSSAISVPPVVSRALEVTFHVPEGSSLDVTVSNDPSPMPIDVALIPSTSSSLFGCSGTWNRDAAWHWHVDAMPAGDARLVVAPDGDGVTIPVHVSMTSDGQAPTVTLVRGADYSWPGLKLCNEFVNTPRPTP